MKKSIIAVAACLALFSLGGADIFLAGDSTCATYSPKRAPLTGWGQRLQGFCKDGVKVHNHAFGGASTKNFLASKTWNKLIANVKKGDYVVIQFGHNDSHSHNKRQYTVPGGTYDANLKKFIAAIRAKGAIPVIATSIARARFSKKGIIVLGSLGRYCDAARKVANAEKVLLVDLNAETVKLFNKTGQTESHKWFMCSVQKNKDVTHLNKTGAEVIAKLFVDTVKRQKHPFRNCFK